MTKYYRPKKPSFQKHRKRSALGRFFVILRRIFKPGFVALWRVIRGKKGNNFKSIAKLAGLASLAGIVFVTLAGFITVGVYSRDLPDPNKLIDRQVAQSTKIYDRTGENLLYEISADQKRTIIKLEDLPDYVPQAVIALEDKTFYEHSGFNFKRLVLAVTKKILGQRGPGASTLTSQLVKNAILSPERTISRKLKEMILTYQIERNFNKEEILQLYLNEIPYGSTAYGVEAASNFYFDKSASELSLAESAVLAAIIQRPTYYSPYGSNADKLLARKDLTLSLMEEQGYISEEERDNAQNEELSFKQRREDITAPHFVFYIREQLVERYGEHMVNQGGLVVKTTIDLDKQKIAEEVITERAEVNKDYDASNAALVSIDPKTGEIMAMVGSVDYFNEEIDGNVNVVTRPRQPGSSFKPIVYTLGWQRGYTPTTVLFDVVTTFPATGGPYEPKNYDLGERGPVSLRKALQGSLNIPAVKMLYLLGVEQILDFAEDLGYSTFQDRSRFGLSLVLGGGEVTLLEHTAAYATLAADGLYREPLGILEVQTSDGHVLDEFESKEQRVIDENIARITSNVLSDNGARAYAFGANNPLVLPGRPVAAKTGTTNDYRDAWTMGYTPNLATGVWAGNNDFSEMRRGAGGSTVAAPIWNAYMRQALAEMEVEGFTAPKIPAPEKAVLSGVGFGVKQVTIDKATEKLATEFTPESFRVEKLFIDAHNILHYIDKRNPAGPAPSDPASADPQYQKWEEAVQAWIQARIDAEEPIFSEENTKNFPEGIEIVYGLPPEEEDDVHTPDNKPSISIAEPSAGDVLESRRITVEANANAARGISRIEYYFDNVLIGTVSNPPYQLTSSLKSFPNGFYQLTAIAYDDVDNSRSTSIQLQLQSDESYIKVDWLEPDNNAEYLTEDLPINFSLNIDSPLALNQVTFFEQGEDGNEKVIDALLQPSTGTLQLPWSPEAPGRYKVYAKISAEESGIFSTTQQVIFINEPQPEEPENAEEE